MVRPPIRILGLALLPSVYFTHQQKLAYSEIIQIPVYKGKDSLF